MKLTFLALCSLAISPMLFGQTGGACSLEGQVLNANTGAPIRRAAVTLRFYTPGRASRPGEPPVVRNNQADVEADDEGRFSFSGLEPGGYQVTVLRQGFGNAGLSLGGQMGSPMSSMVYIGEGQQLKGYVVRMAPQAVIAGRVLDSYGDPVQSSQVMALRATPGGRGGSTAASAQTNDLGEYRLANLSPGLYVVSASAANLNRTVTSPGGRGPSAGDKPTEVYAQTYYPDATDATKAKTVTVDTGAEVRGIDIKLGKVMAVSVSGRIIDPQGSADRPASVSLRQRNRNGAQTFINSATSMTPDGSFQIRAVPPGSYDLVAQRYSNAPNPGPAAVGVQPIEVVDKNLEGITIEVRPSVTLQGTVWGDAARQCDPKNMSVMLSPVDGNYFSGQSSTISSSRFRTWRR